MQRKNAKTEHSSHVNVNPVTGKIGRTLMKEKPVMPIDMIRASLPFYGGTSPASTVPAATTPPAPQPDPAAVAPPAQGEPPAGGVETDDPVAKLAADPNAIGQLLSQVQQLQKDLEEKSGKLSSYEEEKQKAERAQQTREQQLESDLAQRDATIQQMDAVIKNMAITNSMLSQKDIKWNSVKQAIAELQPDEFDIDVDLAKGSAVVSGMDKAAERIAKEFPWLVASEAAPPTNGNPPRPTNKPKSSGNPPAPPSGDGEKQARRNRLMKRYGVLGSGQPIA